MVHEKPVYVNNLNWRVQWDEEVWIIYSEKNDVLLLAQLTSGGLLDYPNTLQDWIYIENDEYNTVDELTICCSEVEAPTRNPSVKPSISDPTTTPSKTLSVLPSANPSVSPSQFPTVEEPTISHSTEPSTSPNTSDLTVDPTTKPSGAPSPT